MNLDVPEKKVIRPSKTQKIEIKNSYCQKVSQRRPKAHDSSIEKRRIFEISNSDIESDIATATTFMLQYYQFDEVERSVSNFIPKIRTSKYRINQSEFLQKKSKTN